MSNAKTKHTPGPWRSEQHGGKMEIWNQNTHIATINTLHVAGPVDDAANARLIAAAPELLEHIRLLVENNVLKNDCVGRQFLNTCKELITEATGGAE